MTMQEILKSQGLTDDQISTIIGEMKQNKIFTASEENLDIRYSKLKGEHDNLVTQHTESTKLIEQLKAGSKDSEALQSKITAYEAQIATLHEELRQSQLDAAIRVALLEANATDLDYMTFRLKEKGELELDESGKIKGIDDRLAGLKTQFPGFFAGVTDQRELQPHTLPNHTPSEGMSRAEFLKKSYAERAAFANENPEAYAEMMKK